MTQTSFNNWQAVHDEVLRRIHSRDWTPGGLIPNEAALAVEFGCARATVNRALRTLAENGVLDRRRKAGTRVALHPVSKATLTIPVIRQEIEEKGQTYGYALITQSTALPPVQIRLSMGVDATVDLLHIKALHTADGAPYVIEDRWINQHAITGAATADYANVSANEWLLANAPYTYGEISFSAANASAETAAILAASTGDALFMVHRITYDHSVVITSVTLTYSRGYRMNTSL